MPGVMICRHSIGAPKYNHDTYAACDLLGAITPRDHLRRVAEL
jgi:hypothetical protein